MEQTHNLSEIPKDSRIMCELDDGSKYFTFDHIDGMYSYCVTEKGNIFHPQCLLPLTKISDTEEIYRIYVHY